MGEMTDQGAHSEKRGDSTVVFIWGWLGRVSFYATEKKVVKGNGGDKGKKRQIGL